MTRLLRPGLPNASQLLQQLFENPQLVATVRELPGPVLGQLIDSVGLEDAAELVALATTQQLETVFDEDLWQAGPDGRAEHFDPARFGLWLHAFAEAGDAALVQRLIELPVDFLTMAVQRLILVVDSNSPLAEMSEWDEDLDLIEEALENSVSEEWEEFRLIARDESAWDVLIHALFALDRDHHTLLRDILERCAALSTEWIAGNGGLYEVLTSDEMLESDAAAARDERRAGHGYVSAADARAFLELARRGLEEATPRDAISSAYFRSLAQKPAAEKPRTVSSDDAKIAGLLALLESATGVAPTPTPLQLMPHMNSPDVRAVSASTASQLLEDALATLRDAEPDTYRKRMEELTYLANVLVAAPPDPQRRLRPVEALELAVEITARGLELALGDMAQRLGQQRGRSEPRPERSEAQPRHAVILLQTHSADYLFRRGYRGWTAPKPLSLNQRGAKA